MLEMGGRDKDRVETGPLFLEFNLCCYGHLANTKKDRKLCDITLQELIFDNKSFY